MEATVMRRKDNNYWKKLFDKNEKRVKRIMDTLKIEEEVQKKMILDYRINTINTGLIKSKKSIRNNRHINGFDVAFLKYKLKHTNTVNEFLECI